MLTRWGSIMGDLLRGREVGGLSEQEMRRACRETHQLTPRRYVRAHRGPSGYRVAIVGPPVRGGS